GAVRAGAAARVPSGASLASAGHSGHARVAAAGHSFGARDGTAQRAGAEQSDSASGVAAAFLASAARRVAAALFAAAASGVTAAVFAAAAPAVLVALFGASVFGTALLGATFGTGAAGAVRAALRALAAHGREPWWWWRGTPPLGASRRPRHGGIRPCAGQIHWIRMGLGQDFRICRINRIVGSRASNFRIAR